MANEEAAGRSQTDQLASLSCPVCGEGFDGLTRLNKHLDIDHGFNDGGVETAKRSTKGARTSKAQHIVKSHWEKVNQGTAICHKCGISCKSAGLINCRKCGRLFCNLHCRNIIKLNSKAEYDPINGKWYACCYECFDEKPGYNDYGSVVDITDAFIKLRDSKNEDDRLRVLQLENRLVRLVDGMNKIHQKYRGSIFINFAMGGDTSRLERTVTPWREDGSVLDCYICLKPFGLTLRKHHCRLCGNVVCNRDATSCSSEISIQHLINAARDLPFKDNAKDLRKVDYSIRLCYKCIKNLYGERKFKRDLQKSKPELILLCESLQSTCQVINVIIAQMAQFMEKVDDSKVADKLPGQEDMNESKRLRSKLLRTVAMYNSLTRQLSETSPLNPTEEKIKRSVQLASSGFINDKILHLRQVPGMISDSSKSSTPVLKPDNVKSTDLLFNNLTISEVKEYREKLMVLNEQKFIVETMINDAQKQRRFDEISVLASNLEELTAQINVTQINLGDQGFS